MPRDLTNVIDVVPPYGFQGLVRSRRLDSVVQETFRNALLRITHPNGENHNEPATEEHGAFSATEINRISEHPTNVNELRCSTDATPRFRYEYSKLCKTFPYLPANPVSRTLRTNMKFGTAGSSTTRSNLENHSEFDNSWNSFAMMHSARPNRMIVNKRGRKRLQDIAETKARNLMPREPQSTVCVFHSTAVPPVNAIKYMRSFGELEKVIQTGSRSFRVTYSDLTEACDAVENANNQYIWCSWFHRGLNELRFVRSKNQGLRVIRRYV